VGGPRLLFKAIQTNSKEFKAIQTKIKIIRAIREGMSFVAGGILFTQAAVAARTETRSP
jgi:hypothetical protein